MRTFCYLPVPDNAGTLATQCCGSGSAFKKVSRIQIQEVKKPIENVQVHAVMQNWKIKCKDPFVTLKIIFCLFIFNDFLMSFLMV